MTLFDFIKVQAVEEALLRAGGNQSKAAKELGIARGTLRAILKRSNSNVKESV